MKQREIKLGSIITIDFEVKSIIENKDGRWISCSKKWDKNMNINLPPFLDSKINKYISKGLSHETEIS